MRKILVIMGRYLPGYKDGGPVRSIKNLVDRLGKEYEFRILTTDRDRGDEKPYPQIQYGTWNPIGDAKVWYVKPGEFTKETVEKLASEVDLIYMCGCFNDYARIVLRLKKQNRVKKPVIIASMGLFSPGAFRTKYLKKKTYMICMSMLGYFQNVKWSATSECEAEDIRRQAGKHAVCYIAEDLPRKPVEVSHENSSEKGKCKVVFLSRISRTKNLTEAAKILKVWGEKYPNEQISFDVYGNKEDATYVNECREILDHLPQNVTYQYCGEAPAEEVIQTFAKYDVFLFPTLTENYGHVIFEAMAGGCIPLVSNQTPWTIEKLNGNGKVVSIGDQGGFVQGLQEYVQTTESELHAKAERCIQFAKSYKADENSYKRMFDA